MEKAKKVTMATIKSFIRKNAGEILIRTNSSFDGMTDCVENCKNPEFTPALKGEISESHELGLHGAWFVGSSRDYLTAWERDGMRGFHVSNCCGSFDIAVKI